MKKTDIAMILLIASLSMLVSYFVAGAFLKVDSKQTVKVKVAEPITATIEKPDAAVFNKDAINPTIEVTIGGTNADNQ